MGDGDQGPSRTAVLTAVARAVHREEPRPWVIDDYLAPGLAGREGLVLRERLQAELPAPFMVALSRSVCVRARFAEGAVERAAAEGVGQYVILGAGLDSSLTAVAICWIGCGSSRSIIR